MGIPAHWKNPKLGAIMSPESDVSGNLFFGFCIPLLSLIGQMLKEKETKIREGMFMMGLQRSAFYLATILSLTLFAFIMALFITLILFVLPDVTRASSFFLMFWYHWMILLNIFLMATSLTAYFQQEVLGKIAIFGCLILTQLFPIIIEEVESGLAPNDRIHLRRFFGLFAGVNITWAYGVFSELEFKLDGVTWSSLGTRIISGRTNFSFADAIAMAMVGAALWTVIWMYLDQVLPSEFGIPRKWNFIFEKHFWTEEIFGRQHVMAKSDIAPGQDNMGPFFELAGQEQLAMQGNGECVRVKNLRKEFTVDGTTLTACDDVCLTMYRDEIFVLLGHNGAGKTTLFFMLSGLIPSTSGDASFFGRTIKEQMGRFRAEVGICPQHSVLWDDLTVMEHLLLFASFKGVPSSQAQEQARNLLIEQNMGTQKNTLAGTLSGGMKRKLSLAVAFMGNPTLVYLDEPTALSSRRKYPKYQFLTKQQTRDFPSPGNFRSSNFLRNHLLLTNFLELFLQVELLQGIC